MKTNLVVAEVAYLNEHQDLIDGCKKGDQKAQFQIYKLYYKAMYNTSLKIVRNAAEAEDIMQESFLSAFEKIGTYSGAVSFGAWLKRIVQNRSIDALNKKEKMVFENIESVRGPETDVNESPYPDEEQNFRMNKILEAIKRLPEGCRKIFSLFMLEGYDHDEISEILSISGSTSRSQFSRARQKIIRDLENS